ncbi:MAG: antitoxin [Chloroflexi bacterium]|nr:MAG: antitoxin [Chloroflexota bacterium]TMG71678.1 MAG: antitoxin [Chloroflexota bacterium]
MCMLSRRLQILLDERRYRRLHAEARARRASVGALVREAIDKAFPVSLERKRAAAKAILSARPMPLPADIADLKAELAEIRAGAKK